MSEPTEGIRVYRLRRGVGSTCSLLLEWQKAKTHYPPLSPWHFLPHTLYAHHVHAYLKEHPDLLAKRSQGEEPK